MKINLKTSRYNYFAKFFLCKINITGNRGGDAVSLFQSTAAKVVDQSYLQWMWEEDNIERIEMYETRNNYYNGDIEVSLPSDVKTKLPADVVTNANICAAVVNAAVRFLSQKPLQIQINLPSEAMLKVRRDEQGEIDENDPMAKLQKEAQAAIEIIFKRNKFMRRKPMKVARLQSKKGECAIKINWDGEKNVLAPEDIKLVVLKPDVCFPRCKDENYEEFEYFAISYDRIKDGKTKKFAQILRPGRIEEYEKHNGMWVKIKDCVGISEIPVAWVRNQEDDSKWSMADITPTLIDIQDALNKMLTDLVISTDFDSFKETWIEGGEAPEDDEGKPKPIERGAGITHWLALDGGGDKPNVKFSEPSSFEGLISAIDKTLDLISVVSGTPKNELNLSINGNLPSGVALRMLYQSFIGLIDEKKMLLEDAYEELISKIFLALNENGGPDYTMMIPKVTVIAELPADEKEQNDIIIRQVEAGLESPQSAMRRQGKTKEEIEEIMNETEAWNERFGDSFNTRVFSEILNNQNTEV